MGAVPVEANAAAFFQSVDQEMTGSMTRLGNEWQTLRSSWSGDASDAFQHVVKDWHLAHAGLFGNEYTQQRGVIGEIARQMGVPWTDRIPSTNNGQPPAPGMSPMMTADPTALQNADPTVPQNKATNDNTVLNAPGQPRQTGCSGGLFTMPSTNNGQPPAPGMSPMMAADPTAPQNADPTVPQNKATNDNTVLNAPGQPNQSGCSGGLVTMRRTQAPLLGGS